MINKNICETFTGVMNIAPVKISGQYKIVVKLNGDLYLDDYTGRQKIIDKSISFLEQVSNFLKTKSDIVDLSVLRYGGFQKSNMKKYHIPLYFRENNYPKYFVLSRVPNETLTDVNYLYKYGKLVNVIDLEKVGLKKIFDEINNQKYYNYPLYFNWTDSNIRQYGFSIDSCTHKYYQYSLINSQANQPYLHVLNNTILNNYVKQNMIFPRFINLEFEFEYVNNYVGFNNFYGYLSFGEQIIETEIDDNNFNIKLKDFVDKIEFTQLKSTDIIQLNTYTDYVSTSTALNILNLKPQFRFKTTRLSVGDRIAIQHPNTDIELEYYIKSTDIVPTSLLETFRNICNSCNKLSKNNYQFTIESGNSNYVIIKVIPNFMDDSIDDFRFILPIYFQSIDRFDGNTNYYEFRSITNYDIALHNDSQNLDDINIIEIDDKTYNVVDKFKFNDKKIFRLDSEIHIDNSSIIRTYHNETEQVIKLEPITFLSVDSSLKSLLPYEGEKYSAELKTKFVNTVDVDNFKLKLINGINQYIGEDSNDLIHKDEIVGTDYNNEQIKNMMFGSVGSTSYITPNILNIDKQFYVQNGNTDTNKLDEDILRFNWFLIKGICPDYIKNDKRSLRYFTDIPKLLSSVVKVSDDYCETIFLGVKYQLPSKYVGYRFATYLNFNEKKYSDVVYKFEINDTNKTIFLSVNKYLDFVDLIRGGIDDNEPLLDLSFFYSVSESFNTKSEYVGDFKSSNIKLCDSFLKTDAPIYFMNNQVRDWKYQYNGKWYIALRLNESAASNKINDFNQLFPTKGDSTFYVYTSIRYNGELYDYVSMRCTVKNIFSVSKTYLWCEDIDITFFDNEKLYLHKYIDFDGNEEVICVNKSDIVNNPDIILDNKTDNIFGDYIKTFNDITSLYTVDNKLIAFNENLYGSNGGHLELLLPDKTLSLKSYYFEITQLITEDLTGKQNVVKSLFRFPENVYAGLDDSQMITKYYPNMDNAVYDSKIDIFSVNQIWNIIKVLFNNNLKFKNQTKLMVRTLINKLMVTSLNDYCSENSIQINDSDEYVKLSVIDNDRNVVVWNVLNMKKILLINRFKAPYYPYMDVSKSLIAFQVSKYKTTNSLFNIYDKDFGGIGISATGLWSEISGNIVSSLFCKTDNIEIEIPYISSVNIKDLLYTKFYVDDCIIINNNIKYIEKINKNVNQYIIESYISYLLNNFYYLDCVVNENNQKLSYTYDSNNNYVINLTNNNSNNLTFIFKRK